MMTSSVSYDLKLRFDGMDFLYRISENVKIKITTSCYLINRKPLGITGGSDERQWSLCYSTDTQTLTCQP